MNFYLAEHKKNGRRKEPACSKVKFFATFGWVALRDTLFGLTDAMQLCRTIPGKPTDPTHGKTNVIFV